MATYKISDLINMLHEIASDNYEYVDIPENYNFETSVRKFSSSDICPDLLFTFDEIFTLKQALDNALEYMKKCSNDPSYSKATHEDIKKASIAARNLQAKFAKFMSQLK